MTDHYRAGDMIGAGLVAQVEAGFSEGTALDLCMMYNAVFDRALIRCVQLMLESGESRETIREHYHNIVDIVTDNIIINRDKIRQ